MDKKNLRILLTPIVLALAIVAGMLIDRALPRGGAGMDPSHMFMPVSGSKMDVILNMVQNSYVDTVDIYELQETAIPLLLQTLDPHTVYIPTKDMQRANEGIIGNFGGVGVQFYKYLDTVTVVKVVAGGPSENAGIKDGDRILRVNDTLIAGVNMDLDKIMGMMRGEIGTEVELTVKRIGMPELMKITVERGSIPVKSVDVAYMVNDTVGYVKVGTFGMQTYLEFMQAMAKLQRDGMKKLILDLRDNEGGVLPVATQMINEFLPADRMILYTEGQASPRKDFMSNGKGNFQTLPIDVLINEFSASASEIFAGAIQDNDRGMIIGRRSFGKGLVQEQRMLSDGSAIRLTVARYYTPSGRSIQKPYDHGNEDYYSDIYNRLLHGEFAEKDSITFDENLKYTTIGGRTVYGGGGIMPDIFVPADTTGNSRYLADVSRTAYLYDYTFEFMDKHRQEMQDIKDYKELQAYLKRFDLVNEMADYAARRGLKRNEWGIRESGAIMRNRIEAYIGRHLLDDDGFYPILGQMDSTLHEAVKQ